MISGDLADLTELLLRVCLTAVFKQLKSVGWAYVLVPIYLIELNACGIRPTSANLCLIISSAFLEAPPKMTIEINNQHYSCFMFLLARQLQASCVLASLNQTSHF
jgi:hypothetical protein